MTPNRPVPGPRVPNNRRPAPSLPTRRPLRPSAAGVRWLLSEDLPLRFAKDMQRVHLDDRNRTNMLKLKYLTGPDDRPSDAVLATLLRLFVRPSDARYPFRRIWLLRQTATGWNLQLELRSGPTPVMRLNSIDEQGAPVELAAGRIDLRKLASLAQRMWHAADEIERNPGQPSPYQLLELRYQSAVVA